MEPISMKKCCPNDQCAKVFVDLLNACEKHKNAALAVKEIAENQKKKKSWSKERRPDKGWFHFAKAKESIKWCYQNIRRSKWRFKEGIKCWENKSWSTCNGSVTKSRIAWP